MFKTSNESEADITGGKRYVQWSAVPIRELTVTVMLPPVNVNGDDSMSRELRSWKDKNNYKVRRKRFAFFSIYLKASKCKQKYRRSHILV